MREIYDQQIYWNDGLEELIFLLGARSTEEKIASFLIFLNIRQYRYLQDPLYKEIPLSRADIGDFLGMRVETVSRTLSKFRKLKAIKSFDNNRIKILDYAALTKIAELEDSWKYWDQKHTHHS
jgi:CRP-like cAMP-binding protein